MNPGLRVIEVLCSGSSTVDITVGVTVVLVNFIEDIVDLNAQFHILDALIRSTFQGIVYSQIIHQISINAACTIGSIVQVLTTNILCSPAYFQIADRIVKDSQSGNYIR